MFIGSTFTPLVSFFLTAVFGRFIGRTGSWLVAVVGLFLCLIGFVIGSLVNNTWGGNTVFFINGTSWIGIAIQWGFVYDVVSLEMGLLISTITFCVILYAGEYMFHDPYVVRFLSYLSLFAFFMLFLVTGSNLLQMFIGWEGVGMTSFLLINFWFMRLEANRSSLKAMVFNRIGDNFYLLALVVFLLNWNTLDVMLINYLATFSSEFILMGQSFDTRNVAALSLFLAAVGKSAQLGLHAWLPDAMEGPTPVSALLHSATMVTAGVFILLRFSPLFYLTTLGSVFVAVGALTALINAVFGFFQWDLKKIIAFSTCSQLGLMVVSVLYDSQIGFYHLMNHGFFKSLLFLTAGSVIHGMGDEQDLRKLGGLRSYLPFTCLCMLVGSAALVGFPFLSGFYSKEWVLFYPLTNGELGWFPTVIYTSLVFTSIFTTLYSIKLLWYVFIVAYYQGNMRFLKLTHEPGWPMTISLTLLTLLSICFGFWSEDWFIGFGSSFGGRVFGVVITQSYQNLIVDLIQISYKMFLVMFFVFSFVYLYKVLVVNGTHIFILQSQGNVILLLIWLLSNRLGFVSVYRYVSKTILFVSYRITFQLFDRGLFERLGPTQVVNFLFQQKNSVFNAQTVSFNQILWLFCGGLFVCSFLFLGGSYGYILFFVIILDRLTFYTKNFTC